MNILIPKYIKYAAPINFTMAKAIALVAKIADNPSAAAIVWMKEPVLIPKTDTTPAFLPWDVLRAMIYKVSSPGNIFSEIAAKKKTERFCVPSIINYLKMIIVNSITNYSEFTQLKIQ